MLPGLIFTGMEQFSEQASIFINDSARAWEAAGDGVRRKIMAWEERAMLVKVAFESGAIGALHQHPHAQLTHIESGVFEVEIEGVKQFLKAGDAFRIPADAVHGVVCIEAGVLIDFFSPMRADFL